MASFATCSAEFPDTATQLPEFLECLSTELSAGLDAFFLIFSGALVLYGLHISMRFMLEFN
jgi:hypothetical protein